MTTFDPHAFDLDATLLHICRLDGNRHTGLGYHASALARAYAELAARYQAQLKTIAILRGQTRPPSCNRTGVEAEFTLDGFDAEATPFDPAGVHELNQALANDLDAKDIEIGELTHALASVAQAVDPMHVADLDADPDGTVCVRPCAACRIDDLIPEHIREAATATPATASQGEHP